MFFYEKNDVYKNNINLVNCFGKRVNKKQNKASVTYSNLTGNPERNLKKTRYR